MISAFSSIAFAQAFAENAELTLEVKNPK